MYRSRGSSVGIATGLWAGRYRGFESRQGQEVFSRIIETDSGVHLASYSMGTGVIAWCKRIEGEVDSSPSSADVKSAWSCTATPPIYLNAVDRDSCTFSDI
jgi:hypothetical protein